MRPNILLITADQWRADCFSAAGHPVVKTPNIDRLAGEGVRFARHYAQAAPCAPARASLYTGLYQMNHRVVRNGTPLDGRHDTLALAMRRLGYCPTLFGYTDQAVDPRTMRPDSRWLRTYEGILPGFDVAVHMPERGEPWLEWLTGQGVEIPADFRDMHRPIGPTAPRPTNRPPRYRADQTETAFLAGCFLDWMKARPSGEPWFAHVSFVRPHPPYVTPEPFNAMYDPAAGLPFRRAPTRDQEAQSHPALAWWLKQMDDTRDFVIGADPVSTWDDADFRTVRAVYWGMVSELDSQVGRILDGLDASGRAGDTIVVLTSDHGEMLGDHWSLGKFGYFDEAYAIPLIVRDPRQATAAAVDAFTESIDVMLTLIELVGGTPPGHLDGKSLAPFLADETPRERRDAVHWEFDFRDVVNGTTQTALGLDLDSCSLAVRRDARFKYVHFAGLPPLLFDLADDPEELVNRTDDPAYAAVRLDQAEALLAWRARHLDRTLTGVLLTEDGPVDART